MKFRLIIQLVMIVCFMNDGKGKFTKVHRMHCHLDSANGSCVRAADFDGDGDLGFVCWRTGCVGPLSRTFKEFLCCKMIMENLLMLQINFARV